jgi:hypothetical protein
VDLSDVLRAVRSWADQTYPGNQQLTISLVVPWQAEPLRFPIPPAGALPAPAAPEPVAAAPFVPNAFQMGILKALEGKGLRTTALGLEVHDQRRLFKPGGLKELKKQGLVAWHPRIGFYRPDAPPEVLKEQD